MNKLSYRVVQDINRWTALKYLPTAFSTGSKSIKQTAVSNLFIATNPEFCQITYNDIFIDD